MYVSWSRRPSPARLILGVGDSNAMQFLVQWAGSLKVAANTQAVVAVVSYNLRPVTSHTQELHISTQQFPSWDICISRLFIACKDVVHTEIACRGRHQTATALQIQVRPHVVSSAAAPAITINQNTQSSSIALLPRCRRRRVQLLALIHRLVGAF